MPTDAEAQIQPQRRPIRAGYPRFAALLSSDETFRVFRRFTQVRMRLLLAQQDEVSKLEEMLKEIDRNEKRALFLGSLRSDKNPERYRIMNKLKSAINEFEQDDLMDKATRALGLPAPEDRDVQSLKDWLEGAGFNLEETAYLQEKEDLASLPPISDRATRVVEAFLEKTVTRASRTSGHRIPFLACRPRMELSDENVRVFILGPLMRVASRIVAICVVSLILMLPTLLLPVLDTLAQRAAASIITTPAVLIAIALLTRARTIELVACGASYTAVVVALTAAMPTAVNVCSVSAAHLQNATAGCS